MIYVCIKDNKLDQANKWIANHFVGQPENTFVVNKQKKNGNQAFCVASFVDDGSEFVEAVKDHFGYTDYVDGYYNTRKIPKSKKQEKASTDAAVTGDQSDFIAGLVDIGD